MKKLPNPQLPPPESSRRLIRMLCWIAAAIIALLPLHAFLTVWLSSIFGHYTALRLWKEVLVSVILLGCFLLLAASRRPLPEWLAALRRRPIAVLIVAYLWLLLGSGLAACASSDVSARALAYGMLLDSRFLVFFGLVWLISRRSDWLLSRWRQLLLVPATVVVLFGILQFTVLPADFLKHAGYGPDTIAAVQTVDQKVSYQRLQSTLRGANPLGAYLIVIIAALLVLMRGQERRGRDFWMYAALLGGSGLVLILTYSRSAWMGLTAAVAWLIWQGLTSAKLRRLLLAAACAVLLIAAGIGWSLRQNDVFQNTILHTDEHSTAGASSNQGHLLAAREGLYDIVRHPGGSGTGTAGPASVYNTKHSPRIAENYYLQIAQETGVAGLAIFAAILALVGRGLYIRRANPLAHLLLASLIGISIVGLLTHVWADDTLSYIWWGLAGAALTLPLSPPSREPFP